MTREERTELRTELFAIKQVQGLLIKTVCYTDPNPKDAIRAFITSIEDLSDATRQGAASEPHFADAAQDVFAELRSNLLESLHEI